MKRKNEGNRAVLSSLSEKKVLVTGASGFIGGLLCSKLVAMGCDVHAASRYRRASGSDPIRWSQLDMIDAKKVETLVTKVKPDIIYHLASLVTGTRDPNFVIPILQNNLLTTVHLLHAANKTGCDRFLSVGSMEEPDPSDPLMIPGSPYAAAKWASSAYGRMYHTLYHLPIVLLRVFMVYGEGQKDPDKLIPYVIRSLLRGEAPKVSSGKRRVDWIYVEDAVDGLLAAAEAKHVEGRTIDIGSGTLRSIRNVVEYLVEITQATRKPMYGALEDRPLEPLRVADADGAESLLGWRARTALEEGLVKTVAWYRQMANAEAL
jgi:UDP-glucose 4-epimerase